MQTTGRDPLGHYMIGFTRDKTPEEACVIARSQQIMADQVGDTDGAAFWNQVLSFLAITTGWTA